jgi:hypothetical protein
MKINKIITNLEQYMIINEQVFKDVQNFRYLGVLIHSRIKNLRIDAIK